MDINESLTALVTRGNEEKCIIIPAIKKNIIIPEQLTKKLHGVTLIQRAINTAKQFFLDKEIYVVTDSHEISLISERNQIKYLACDSLLKNSYKYFNLDYVIQIFAQKFNDIILFRPNAPLINEYDLKNAYKIFKQEKADLLVTIKEEAYQLWKSKKSQLNKVLLSSFKHRVEVETRAFYIISSTIINKNKTNATVVPYILTDEKSIEIESYHHWWICEKILQRKRIVFVVSGYPAIGMGQIFRSLTLAHEITEHEVIFLCTKESELALKNIASKDYQTLIQINDLATDVLQLKPDLVINDILDTSASYIKKLKMNGVKVVNFEDLKAGGRLADITFNELYDKPLFKQGKNIKWGHQYFFLRDEFAHSVVRKFKNKVTDLLITFGGSDASNYSYKTLQTLADFCQKEKITIRVVVGPGYLYKDKLKKLITSYSQSLNITYHDSTNIMSKIMEKTDIAVCSAGRTVYELAHMNIPAIVMSHHHREDGHTFARSKNGFVYLGVMSPFNNKKLLNAFQKLLNVEFRKKLLMRMKKFDFYQTKKSVVTDILRLLNE